MALSLGFDTSGPWCGAALLRGEDCLAARHDEMQKGQAEHLMPMIEAVLAEGNATLQDLDCIGAGIGPGNFTGVRISVSAARGLALALGIPAVGVSILEAAVFGTDGPVLAAMDARRGQGYFQRFGFGDPVPFLSDLQSLAPIEGVTCIGSLATDAAAQLGGSVQPARYAPAAAIARIAAERFATTSERPKPLYLRAADAAPPREAPPKILA